MHVALLTDGLYPYVVGGMQRHSRMLLEQLAKQGVRVSVFHTTLSERAAKAALALEGLPEDIRPQISAEFVEYPRRGRYPGHYLGEQREYSRRCLERFLQSKCRADFVYAQGLTGLAFEDLRSRGGSVPPVAVNVHGYEPFQTPPDFRTRLQYLMLRPALRKVNQGADLVFCFSGKIREIVESRICIDSARIAEVPNGIDASWIADAPRASGAVRKFLFIGRYDRRKGLPELLDALGRLDPDGAWSLEVVGPVPPEAVRPTARVRLHGAISDSTALRAIIDTCDVLVCPSFAEGMPTVILEAMARGLAILATDAGATREIVDSRNGILIDRPRPAVIAEALKRLIGESGPRLDAMKWESLERSKSYTWDIIARSVINAMKTRLGSV